MAKKQVTKKTKTSGKKKDVQSVEETKVKKPSILELQAEIEGLKARTTDMEMCVMEMLSPQLIEAQAEINRLKIRSDCLDEWIEKELTPFMSKTNGAFVATAGDIEELRMNVGLLNVFNEAEKKQPYKFNLTLGDN
jgi:hypothetical protein